MPRCAPFARGKMRLVDTLWLIAIGRNPFRLAHLRYPDMRMACDLRQTLQCQYYFFDTYFLEERLLEIWYRMAGSASIVFNVDANAGIYRIAALAT